MSYPVGAARRSLLRWNFPELETSPTLVLSPAPPAADSSEGAAVAADPDDAAEDQTSLTEMVGEQIAKGYAEGWQRGLAEGREAGYAEGIDAGTKAAEEALAVQSERLTAILTQLRAPLPALESVVEEAVVGLALEVARCVIGSETNQSREYLVKLIRQAIAKVPIEMSRLKVVVNPADLDLIRGLAPEIESRSAALVGDDSVEPGDCFVVADGRGTAVKDMRWRPRAGEGMSQVDLSLATRWRAVMLALFEGEDKMIDQTASLRLVDRLERYRARISRSDSAVTVHGSLVRTVGLVMEARGIHVAIGERCFVENESGRLVPAEAVGFDGGRVFLMAEGAGDGFAPGARVMPAGRMTEVAAGPQLLGRVLDGSGAPIDGKGKLGCTERTPLFGRSVNPMRRAMVEHPLDVGVRSINALLTVGRGSRLGLFAGSGVGKSVLLGMMARYTSADVVVVGLIGERGREVKEFIERVIGAGGLAKAVVVAAPADASALGRVHGAYRATAIAEYFRDQRRHVLLLMDSLTRFALAQREIGLAIGEIPATKGYPPSVFGRIASLCERAGNAEEGSGSITALYTVLMEGDDLNDPVEDATRAILDGHLVLSRKLADAGQFPALDIGASVSRVMSSVVPAEQITRAQRFKQLYSRFEQSRDMIAIGGYRPGHDAELDRAVTLRPAMDGFLSQDLTSAIRLADSVAALHDLLGE